MPHTMPPFVHAPSASPGYAKRASLCDDLSASQRSHPSPRWLRAAGTLGLALWLAGCTLPATAPAHANPAAAAAAAAAAAEQIQLPLLRGWFEGLEVLYVTTDASDREVAREHDANYAPVLANALRAQPSGHAASPANAAQRPGATDRVYGTTNFKQSSVFASAPEPMGHQSSAATYSPLWQLVKVTWNDPTTARTLRSEEEVLDAAEKGQLTLEVTRIVINCPIVYRGKSDALPGVTINPTRRE